MDRSEFRPIAVNGSGGRAATAGEGAAPPVVFVGSPFARMEAYRVTVAELARRGRVVAVELPGVGPTGRPAERFTAEAYADWTAGCLDALGVETATLVGHSHSGAVALLTAARHPARVGRLVLADSTGSGPHPFWPCFWGRLADTVLVEFGLVLRAGHHLLSSFAAHPRNFIRQTRASLAADLLAAAERVRVPALLAWGEQDRTLPPGTAARFAARLPDATVYLSPGGSHCWPLTHPAEFAAAVAAWSG